MPLDATEFERRSEDFFAASYLASLGVIQNVVLGFLAAKIFASSPSALLWLQAAGSFIVIILIVAEYHWWLLIVRRTPTFLDASIPYILGAAELAAIGVLDDATGRWLIRMGVLGILGICALYNSREYCTEELFRECSWLRYPARRNLSAGMILVAAMVISLFITWLFWERMSESLRWISFFLFYGLVIVMITVSARLLQRIKQKFDRLRTTS